MTTTTTSYVIIKTSYFYGPKIVKSLVKSEKHQVLTFETAAEAEKYIAELDEDTYYTAHNESGCPGYKVVNTAKLPAYLACQLEPKQNIKAKIEKIEFSDTASSTDVVDIITLSDGLVISAWNGNPSYIAYNKAYGNIAVGATLVAIKDDESVMGDPLKVYIFE
tara:strand:- start:459 stop:950 length:492 start_codon:yes stop_codon:yes gene_type:complete